MAELTYAQELRSLAEELQAIAALPPERAMMRLGPLLDYASASTGALARLREARRKATLIAVGKAGSPAKLARALGVSEVLVSRIVRGARRHSNA